MLHIPKVFDDTTNPGKPRIIGINQKHKPDRFLEPHEMNIKPIEYALLTWGKATGFEHPMLSELNEKDT